MHEQLDRWVALLLIGGGALLAAGAGSVSGTPARIALVAGACAIIAMAGLVGVRVVPARTGILIALVVGTTLFALRLSSMPLADTTDVSAVGHVAFRGIVLLAGAAFIALGPARGLVLSALTWTAAVAIMAIGGMPVGRGSAFGQGIVGVALSGAVAILMFRLLSSSVVQARVQAEVAQSSAELAFLDDLTGLPNRRQMTVHLGAAVARAVEGGGPDTLVMFDLDHFKAVNDTMGHEVGDEVLRRTSAVAIATLREGDVLGRWGGEEFLVLLNGADEAEAVAIAERCRRALAAVQGPSAVTASFGVSAIAATDTVTDALRRADLALYEAKAGGRNRIVVRHPGVIDPGRHV